MNRNFTESYIRFSSAYLRSWPIFPLWLFLAFWIP